MQALDINLGSARAISAKISHPTNWNIKFIESNTLDSVFQPLETPNTLLQNGNSPNCIGAVDVKKTSDCKRTPLSTVDTRVSYSGVLFGPVVVFGRVFDPPTKCFSIYIWLHFGGT